MFSGCHFMFLFHQQRSDHRTLLVVTYACTHPVLFWADAHKQSKGLQGYSRASHSCTSRCHVG
jgi:hypothetical protein